MSDDQPKTIVERLDAAQTDEEFGDALGSFFDQLARARDIEDGLA